LGSTVGTGVATTAVVLTQKELALNDIINLVTGNIELLLVCAGLAGMFLPKMVFGTVQFVWNVAKRIFSYRRQPKLDPVAPDGVTIKIRDGVGGTNVTLEGPYGAMSKLFKPISNTRKYENKLRAVTSDLIRRYHIRMDVSLVPTALIDEEEWNPAVNWKSRDGQVRELRDMDSNHLNNVLAVVDSNRSGLGHRVINVLRPKIVSELGRRA
jgi:hypothetical protein